MWTQETDTSDEQLSILLLLCQVCACREIWKILLLSAYQSMHILFFSSPNPPPPSTKEIWRASAIFTHPHPMEVAVNISSQFSFSYVLSTREKIQLSTSTTFCVLSNLLSMVWKPPKRRKKNCTFHFAAHGFRLSHTLNNLCPPLFSAYLIKVPTSWQSNNSYFTVSEFHQVTM